MIKNRWVDEDADDFVARFAGKGIDPDLALRVYTSRLIGSDPDLVMYGGGNTSCKTEVKDIFGNKQKVICVKGSGWDLATIETEGLPAVKLEPLLKLRKLEKLSDEEMVNAQRANLINQAAPNPSIETLLHAFLPHAVVDHTHATAFLSLANLPDPTTIIREIFGDRLVLVPYIMPGFSLAKVAANIAEDNPKAEGLILLKHGHFTWGKNAKESYFRVIEQTNLVEKWFADHRSIVGLKSKEVPNKSNRSLISMVKKAYFDLSDEPKPSLVLKIFTDEEISAQVDSHIANGVVGRGVATPDHVIRIKPKPWVLTKAILSEGQSAINKSLVAYIEDYKKYFMKWSAKTDEPKTILNPKPKVVWVEGFGLIGLAASIKEAKTIMDIAVQNISVISDSERAGGFHPVKDKDLFDMEYWSLEQAKLKKSFFLPLQGKITLVTGAAGAIGTAVVNSFIESGAEVVAIDINKSALEESNFDPRVQKRTIDVTDGGKVEKLIDELVHDFGGVDILVSNAGMALQSPLLELELSDLRRSFEINFFAHFNLAKIIGQLFVEQGNKGQMLFNISKQAVNPGRNFGAYGLPKSTLMFLVKQLSLELGNYGIRVNGVNADRVRSGILSDNLIIDRAGARGLSVEKYMSGNLLNKEVEAHHVAKALVDLALSNRTTGHVITVDGGNIEASLR